MHDDAYGLEVGVTTQIAKLIKYLESRARSSTIAKALVDQLGGMLDIGEVWEETLSWHNNRPLCVMWLPS